MAVRVGVVSAGGRGVRFGQDNIQKCLVPIEGKPILGYTIDAFLQAGMTTIFILTGFLGEQVNAYVAAAEGEVRAKVKTVFGGTAGQIQAILKLEGLIKEDFLYSGGDCIFPASIVRKLIRTADEHEECVAVMAATTSMEFVQSHPRLELIRGSRLVEKVHKPSRSEVSGLAGTGMYYFRPEAFKLLARVEPNPTSPVAEFVQQAHAVGQTVVASVTSDPLFYLHTPEDLVAWHGSRARKLLSENQELLD